MPIGGLFKDQFKAGDVIYGRCSDRWRYALPPELRLKLVSEGQYIYINGYNDNTFGEPLELQRLTSTRPPETERNIKLNLAYHGVRSDLTPAQKAALQKHYNALKQTKYAPLKAVKMESSQMEAKGNLSFTYLVWRRACKFGLQYVIEQMDGTVHFFLDMSDAPLWTDRRIDSVAIVNKARPGGHVPVTTSELRCCYRNRHRWYGRVKFYHQGKEVVPPWIARPVVWARYDEHRRIRKGKESIPDAPMMEMGFSWNHFNKPATGARNSAEELCFSEDHFK